MENVEVAKDGGAQLDFGVKVGLYFKLQVFFPLLSNKKMCIFHLLSPADSCLVHCPQSRVVK